MITIHRQLKYVLFFAIGFFVAGALSASAYTITPTGTSWETPITFTITLDSVAELGTQIPANSSHWGVQYRIDGGAWQYPQVCVPTNQTVLSWTENIPVGSYGSFEIELYGTNDPVNCGVGNSFNEGWYSFYFDEPTCTANGLTYDPFGGMCFANYNPLFSSAVTVSAYVAPTTTPTTTPTTGGISFVDFNDITPTDMLASVRQGTIDTADKTLPLLVFLGIPLGFLLVLFLIGLINKTLTPENSTTSRRGNGRGWTAHGAMEHDLTEFKKKQRSRIKRDL